VLATYGAAALIIVASLLVGRAFMQVFGRKETWWLETSVGLAVLVTVCAVCARVHFGAEGTGSIPERGELALIACAVLVVASLIITRLKFVDRASFLTALPVIALTLLMASLPYIASGHLGIPGIGINNDMAAHLIWADWVQEQLGAAPTGIQIGYPLGPHGMAAALSQLLGSEPLYAFLGLLLAIPVITGLTALNLFHTLPPVKRTGAAALVALPYLAASTLGIASFKELLAGLWLLTFVLILRMITRESEGRFALVAALGVVCTGLIGAYSYPGVAWPVAALGLWALAELVSRGRRGELGDLRAALRKAMPVLIAAGVVAIVVAVALLPQIREFRDSVGEVAGTDSKLRYAVAAPEAFGVWPSGEFLFGNSDQGLKVWWIFAAVGFAGLAFAAVWWMGLRDFALPMAVAGSFVIYLGTVWKGGLYVEAKAVAVPASLVMAFILGALLLRPEDVDDTADPAPVPDPETAADPVAARKARRAAEPGGRPSLRTVIAVPFIVLAAYSSYLALRDAVVAPDDRFGELKALRDEVADSSVLALTSDRYTDYYLRGAEVLSPAKNAEQQIKGRQGKEFRLPVDFDSVYASDLDNFDYVVTTDAEYQSGAPPNFEEAQRTDSYVLWRRNGVTPFIGVLAEASRPGRIFRCTNEKFKRLLSRTGVAITWPRPVIAKRGLWEDDEKLEPGDSATHRFDDLPPGRWDLSFQYSSESAPLEVTVGDFEAEMPPGVEGAIPYRPNEGPFWPVGEITSTGGPLEIEVKAKELSTIQRLVGADSPAYLGNITATRLEDRGTLPFKASCKRYIDHYYLGAPGSLQGSKESGGSTLNLKPTR